MFEIDQYEPRPESPRFTGNKKSLIRRVDDKKIHRIRCPLSNVAYVLNVISPSEIYLRYSKTVTPQLTIAFPTEAPAISSPQLLQYVMAPWADNVLGRARIIQILDQGDAYVLFIDNGQYAIVAMNELYEMPTEFRTHPWQAVRVVLHDAQPFNKVSWNPIEVTTLRSVLDNFVAVWAIPQKTLSDDLDDNVSQRVELNGLTPAILESITKGHRQDFDEVGISILNAFVVSLPSKLQLPQNHKLIDAMFQPEYPFYVDSLRENVPRKSIGNAYRLMPLSSEPLKRWFEINPFPQIAKYTLDKLLQTSYVMHNEGVYSIMGFTHNSFENQLPNRFYAFRMKFSKNKEFPRLLTFYNAQKKLKAMLNAFYFGGNNLHSLDFEQVYLALKSGIRVFAIYENHCYHPIYIHNFERIEILACTVEDARFPAFFVRFLDLGSCSKVPLRRVYHVHSQHMEAPPLALLLAYSERFPAEGKQWTVNDRKLFQYGIGADKTIVADIKNTSDVDLTKPVMVKNLRFADNEMPLRFDNLGTPTIVPYTNPFFDLDIDDQARFVERYLFKQISVPMETSDEDTENVVPIVKNIDTNKSSQNSMNQEDVNADKEVEEINTAVNEAVI